MADYQKLLLEIEERNREYQQNVASGRITNEYDDDAYIAQELEIYQKYLKEGKKAFARPDGLKLSNKDVEDEQKLNQLLNTVKSDLSWLDTLSQTSLEDRKPVDIDNNLERELSFYESTLKSVTLSISKLDKMGIPSIRPPDYFAEMVKSDEHMHKIKTRLLQNKEIIRSRLQKKKEESYKSKSKLLQAEAIQQKIQRKKDAIAAIEQWRKYNKESDVSFDIREAERLYEKSKNLSKDKVKELYKTHALKKSNKMGKKGKK